MASMIIGLKVLDHATDSYKGTLLMLMNGGTAEKDVLLSHFLVHYEYYPPTNDNLYFIEQTNGHYLTYHVDYRG
jgi:hypothetical protein